MQSYKISNNHNQNKSVSLSLSHTHTLSLKYNRGKLTKHKSARDDTVRDRRREERMCKLGERERERKEEGRGHDEAQAVHREVVVDPVQQKVQRQERRGVGQPFVDVE